MLPVLVFELLLAAAVAVVFVVLMLLMMVKGVVVLVVAAGFAAARPCRARRLARAADEYVAGKQQRPQQRRLADKRGALPCGWRRRGSV